MKMPSKGTPVQLRNGGAPLFVGASNLNNAQKSSVLLKYEGGELDEGYGRGIIEISYDEFRERRVYPEQLSDSQNISDIVKPNKLRQRLQK